MRKTDEIPLTYLRSHERVYSDEGGWFVRTREGVRGPFASPRAAEAEVALFVDTMEYLEQNGTALPADLNRADVTVVDMKRLPWC